MSWFAFTSRRKGQRYRLFFVIFYCEDCFYILLIVSFFVLIFVSFRFVSFLFFSFLFFSFRCCCCVSFCCFDFMWWWTTTKQQHNKNRRSYWPWHCKTYALKSVQILYRLIFYAIALQKVCTKFVQTFFARTKHSDEN